MAEYDIFGLVRPENDIHTLGLATVASLLEDCDYTVHSGNADVVNSILNISLLDSRAYLKKWIEDNRITRIGFSY